MSTERSTASAATTSTSAARTSAGSRKAAPVAGAWLRSAAAACAALLLGGCILFNPPKPTAPDALELSRETPAATYAYFKEMAKNNQWAAEWSVFSPNFKRLMNQAVGRNVDAGDYNLARQTLATNSQADMQLLINSKLDGVQMLSDKAAVVSITGGGKQLRPRMVKLTRWELKVKGDDTPYGDFVADASDAVRIAQDGSITVMIRPPQATASLLRTFTPDQIDSFKVEGQWYVDDFGGIDQLVVERSEGGQAQPQQPPVGQPSYPQPVGSPDMQPRYPPPAPGAGSPDGPPAPPAAGYGSPDG
jgi:hypothetical protein